MGKKVSATAWIKSDIKANAKLKKKAKETFKEIHNFYGDLQP